MIHQKLLHLRMTATVGPVLISALTAAVAIVRATVAIIYHQRIYIRFLPISMHHMHHRDRICPVRFLFQVRNKIAFLFQLRIVLLDIELFRSLFV